MFMVKVAASALVAGATAICLSPSHATAPVIDQPNFSRVIPVAQAPVAEKSPAEKFMADYLSYSPDENPNPVAALPVAKEVCRVLATGTQLEQLKEAPTGWTLQNYATIKVFAVADLCNNQLYQFKELMK